MQQISNTDLYIGGIDSWHNLPNKESWAVVHATQTIHYGLIGWDRQFNKPDKNHPNYIVLETENRLSLNWVDGSARLYEWSGPETFNKVLDFIDTKIQQQKVLIHCDQGQSRSPTLGLLYLAKRTDLITNSSFDEAQEEFIHMYPNYLPAGISDYARANWNEIN